MRRLIALLVVCSTPVLGWDGFKMFTEATTGPTSGGGGIWGTGSKRDHAITCAACHAKAQAKINVALTFNPPLENAGAGYKVGRRYQVTAALQNQWLGRGFVTCGMYLMSMNGFVATFETAGGLRAGRLESDSGQDSNACPATIADIQPGTTVTYGKCEAIVNSNTEDQTQWTFFWTGPAAGTGPVTMFYGAVDGNCDMKASGDDVKTGSRVLAEVP